MIVAPDVDGISGYLTGAVIWYSRLSRLNRKSLIESPRKKTDRMGQAIPAR
jgi:hypothetical protein